MVTSLRLLELLLPGSYQYLDPDDPKAGVKVLYGGGSMCSGDIPGLVYSTWYVQLLKSYDRKYLFFFFTAWIAIRFEIHCNSAISDISKGFVKVHWLVPQLCSRASPFFTCSSRICRW